MTDLKAILLIVSPLPNTLISLVKDYTEPCLPEAIKQINTLLTNKKMSAQITRIKANGKYLVDSKESPFDDTDMHNPNGYVVEIKRGGGVYISNRVTTNGLVTAELRVKRSTCFKLMLMRQLVSWPSDIQQIKLTMIEPNPEAGKRITITNNALSCGAIVPVIHEDTRYTCTHHYFEL